MEGMFGTILHQAWQRSEGKCHCTRLDHGHPYVRCNKHLLWDKQDKPYPGGWKLHRRLGFHRKTSASMEILCWECYQKVTQNLK